MMMDVIRKKIVLDENNKPSEVIVNYGVWKKLKKYIGILHLNEDPLDFQRRMRNEWK